MSERSLKSALLKFCCRNLNMKMIGNINLEQFAIIRFTSSAWKDKEVASKVAPFITRMERKYKTRSERSNETCPGSPWINGRPLLNKLQHLLDSNATSGTSGSLQQNLLFLVRQAMFSSANIRQQLVQGFHIHISIGSHIGLKDLALEPSWSLSRIAEQNKKCRENGMVRTAVCLVIGKNRSVP